jgi:hypothetical protein
LDGFDIQEKITKRELSGSAYKDTQKEMLQTLRESKNYQRVNYKIHSKLYSRIPDHCMAFSLSDPNEPWLEKTCPDHDHNLKCEYCEGLKTVLDQVDGLVRDMPAGRDRTVTREEFDTAKADILKHKAHQLRTVNQERAKAHILSNLLRPGKDVQMTCDFAMRWLPEEGRWASSSSVCSSSSSTASTPGGDPGSRER